MEVIDIIDADGNVIGTASREECHNGSLHLHGVVHVLVFTGDGRLVVQKRSESKDIQPGKWDTSVGGHINTGESITGALVRESREELGIEGASFERLYTYIMESDIERELVTTYRSTWNGPLHFDDKEIEDVRLMEKSEIESRLETGYFTPNFEEEWKHYKRWLEEG